MADRSVATCSQGWWRVPQAQPCGRRHLHMLTGNGEWGISLLDAGGSYSGCEIGANARGSVAAWLPEEDGVDTARLVADNRLDRPVQWVGPV